MTQSTTTGNDPTDATDSLLEFDIWDVLFGPANAQLGEQAIALFLVAIIVLPLYGRGKDPFLPAIMLVMFAGTIVPMLPGSLVGVAWGVIWMSGTIAIAGLANRLR